MESSVCTHIRITSTHFNKTSVEPASNRLFLAMKSFSTCVYTSKHDVISTYYIGILADSNEISVRLNVLLTLFKAGNLFVCCQ